MDKTGQVGPQSFAEYAVSMFTTVFDQTAWWLLIGFVVLVVGIWTATALAKNMVLGAIILSVMVAVMAYLAGPSTVEFFSNLSWSVLPGLMLGLVIAGFITRKSALYLSGAGGFFTLMLFF